MRVIFVHGIKHENRSADWLLTEWLTALRSALPTNDVERIEELVVMPPFYGDALALETESSTSTGYDPTPMSVGLAQDGEMEFLSHGLLEAASTYGVTEAMIEAEMEEGEVVAMGFPHDRRLIALARALEKVSPSGGKNFLRFLPQAFTYLHKPRARKTVDDIVRPVLAGGPCIVVGHSLGSVVSFNLIRELALDVRCFITIGSPLAIKAVQSAIRKPFGRPPSVRSWLNAVDRDDFVTLGRLLKDSTFGAGVDNLGDVDCGDDDPHDFRMYLQDARVARKLRDACGP